MAAPPTGFGDLLRRHRLAAGLTQEALAERAGLSARGVSDLERGLRRVPYPDTVRRLAEALSLAGAEREAFAASAGRRLGGGPGPASTAPPPDLNPLPTPLTSFVGREREIHEVVGLLRDPTVRLLTLTGPGGVGKTRLALVAAEGGAPGFPGGVAFVSLAPLADPALVLPMVARALGLRDAGDRTVAAQLAGFLAGRAVLLVLDNLEHLAAAASEIARLLAACPDLTVLATSRTVLRVSGEQVYPVPPLGLPALDHTDGRADLAAAEAVSLFVARARAADPAFALTGDNAPSVVDICRRLDGLPLAIELAAAQVRLLPPGALLARLGERLPLLSGGPRDAPPRQRTLRDAIAWSYDLLSPEEQAIFRRLAVFAGGFDLDAANALGSAEGPGPDVMEGVASLVDNSLLRRIGPTGGGPEAPPRYGMLETVREYALERLAANGEEAATRAAHVAHFLGLAEQAEPELRAANQTRWLDRLEADHANLRAALGWLRDQGDAERGLRLSGALWGFWSARGHVSEGRAWLEALLGLPATRARSVAGAKALVAAGDAAVLQLDCDRAVALYEQALATYQHIGDRRGMASALCGLGEVTIHQGEPERARGLIEEGLALASAEEDSWGVALATNLLGVAAAVAGNYAESADRFEQGLSRFRAVEDHKYVGTLLLNLGFAALLAGERRRAGASFAEALALAVRLGDEYLVAWCLEGCAGLAAAGQPDRAARLFGSAAARHERLGTATSPSLQAVQDRSVAAVRAALGEAAFAAERATGRSTPLEEALAEALVVADAPTGEPSA